MYKIVLKRPMQYKNLIIVADLQCQNSNTLKVNLVILCISMKLAERLKSVPCEFSVINEIMKLNLEKIIAK